jgi:hypothetical protein
MFAIADASAIYHLFDTKTKLTVCGKTVSKIRVKDRVKETSLEWTPTRPLDRALCKGCLRITEPVL